MPALPFAILLLTLLLALHLVEEVRTGFRARAPLGPMSRRVFVVANVGVYLFCAATFALALRGHPAAAPMAWILAVGNLLNGLGHIGLMIRARGYFPGGVTAFLLIPAALYLVRVLLAT